MESLEQLTIAVHEIRDLVRLLAEPAIAERDKKLRSELRRVVGNSAAKVKAALCMDGTRGQATIVKETGIHQGQLSSFVKELSTTKLLSGDPKSPKLAVAIPATFFETEAE